MNKMKKNNSCNPKSCEEIKPRVGLRPSFHALWHLPPLKVIDNLEHLNSTAWQNAEKKDPVRVAIIDTPTAYNHPNLLGAIDIGYMRDYSTSDHGNFVVRIFEDRNQNNGMDLNSRRSLKRKTEGVKGDLEEKIYTELMDIESWLYQEKELEKLQEKLTKLYRGRRTPDDDIQINELNQLIKIVEQKRAPSGMKVRNERTPDFGAHGTSVAGLIGARPNRVNLFKPPYFEKCLKKQDMVEGLELPYCGINPYCRIVPISVSSTPNPKMLLQAVRYAQFIEADVVVIADSWDRPNGAEYIPDWQALERAFLKLCKASVVLCAAGNEPRSSLVYPASLSKKGRNGDKGEGPWAVGACDNGGSDFSYSPDFNAIDGHGHRMIKTLSSEHSRYDLGLTKLDPWENVDPELGLPKPDYNFPPTNIIATDVPGDAGYNPSPYRYTPASSDCHYEIASLFCRFSGTSAATAIAAGLVSLAIATRPKNINEEKAVPFEPTDTLFDLYKAEKLVASL